MWKPFKPPLLRKPSTCNAPPQHDTDERPTKKPRLSPTTDAAPRSDDTNVARSKPREPLLKVSNSKAPDTPNATVESYYLVLWRKFTTKKHKTWDGDGVLAVRSGYAYLQDISGRDLGKCMFNEPLLPGSLISLGGREVEVDKVISREEYLAGRPFLQHSAAPVGVAKPKKTLPSAKAKADADESTPPKTLLRPISKSKPMQSQFKTPLKEASTQPQVRGVYSARHNPDDPGALVMRRPTDCPRGKEIVDVVVDPLLTKHLREHQREGVKFLYECVMGMREFNGFGAILADEMGLGKTLQTIALLWTLLKQSPIGGVNGVIKKALIVCPVTLINNWRKEFKKWLGNERIGVLVADGQKTRLTDFTHGKAYNVMIIGYEKLRLVQDELKKGGGIDIVIADEGHRLKTASNKSAQAIISLNTERRVILSGTPMQNDLSEFFVMVDFVNPGTLGPFNTFKKQFEAPILKSRQPDASQDETEKGVARGEELAALTKSFILRRTAEILSKHLKPKSEYVVFCPPTDMQVRVYQSILDSPLFGNAFGSTEASLELITILKKVCNSPKLLISDKNGKNMAALVDDIAPSLQRVNSEDASSKLRLLKSFLRELASKTTEKVVLVSNYTSTLDLLEAQLASMGLTQLRLDGSTPAAKRQGLVDTFNRAPAREVFAFLLSAKSGGAGINLIGASRLVLFDMDWNPATDLQAMARIHRDGQKRPVKIYRFVTAGAMDEKIYQRQVAKLGLADSIVDGKKSAATFTAQELRDLFRLDPASPCQTHDLLSCPCNGSPATPTLAAPTASTPGSPAAPIVIANSDSDDSSHSNTDDDDDMLPSVSSAARARRRRLNAPSPPPALIPASQVNMAQQEAAIRDAAQARRAHVARSKMQALMRYAHVDVAPLRGVGAGTNAETKADADARMATLDDEVLCEVLRARGCRVRYVFVKKG